MNSVSSGSSFMSSGVNLCQSSVSIFNFRGNNEYKPLKPVARTYTSLYVNLKLKKIKIKNFFWYTYWTNI